MRVIPLCLFLIALATRSSAAPPAHVWSQGFGGIASDEALSVAVDGSGNVIISGYFTDTANFGGADLVNSGLADVFLAKYDATGAHLWSKGFGGTDYERATVVATDASDNIVLTGRFTGTADFGGGPLASAGNNDIFLAKYDANGAHLWSQRFGNTGYDAGWDVTLDGSGNILVTGWFSGTVDLGGGSLVSSGNFDIVMAKFDASGAHQWSKSFGGAADDHGISARIDGSGNIFMTSLFKATVDFGGGPLVSAGISDIVVAKYTAGGAHLWSRRFGSTAYDEPTSIGVDGLGNAILGGIFTGTVDFGGGPLVSSGGYDIVVAKYDASGAHQWSQSFGGSTIDVVNAVVVDGPGNVAITGYFSENIDFGGGPLTAVFGGEDAYMAKFDASGAHQWSRSFGDSLADRGNSIAMSGNGDVYLTGSFYTTIDFGGGPLVAVGSPDVFLAKFSEAGTLPVLISRFDATPHAGAVELAWEFSSDEPMDDFVLYRGRDGSAPVMIATGDARTTRSYTDASVEPGATYQYELAITTAGGDEFRSPVATATVPRAIASLAQNFPNPFNPETTIGYTVAGRTEVTIEIFDASGGRVRVLDEGAREAGSHRATWDGRDAANRPVSSGVYFYRLAGVKGTETRKMVLVK